MAGGRAVYVGVLLVELGTPWARSLKQKRSLILQVTEKLKARFPVSVARLDGLDTRDRELIGMTALSSDPVWLEGVLERALEFVRTQEAQVLRSSLEVDVWDRPE